MKNLYIFGEIGWEVTDAQILETLNSLEPNEELTVYINSPGGDVFTGIAIYNLLMEKSPVVKVIGLAGSIASLIACAGKQVLIADSAMFMIHNPWSYAWAGDENYFKKLSETLGQIKQTILKAYRKKTGKTDEDLTDMMTNETWLTSEQAVTMGFADSVYVPGQDELQTNNEITAKNHYRFAALTRQNNNSLNKGGSEMSVDVINNPDKNPETKIFMDKIKELEVENQSFVAQVEALNIEKQKLNADIQNLANSNKDLSDKNQELTTKLYESEERAFCMDLVAQAKMKTDDVDDNVKELLEYRLSGKSYNDKTSWYDHKKTKYKNAAAIVNLNEQLKADANNLPKSDSTNEKISDVRQIVKDLNEKNKI